jgi:hypothetical protein
MAQDQLRKFFREKNRKALPADTNWTARRDNWIKAVDRLYQTIENDYLKDAKAEAAISYVEKVINENHIGEYRIRELHLRVGDEEVVFSPKGTNIIGAKGRIDVQGDRGEATIIWQPGNRWSVVASRTPTLKVIPFDKASIAELLRGIMRP